MIPLLTFDKRVFVWRPFRAVPVCEDAAPVLGPLGNTWREPVITLGWFRPIGGWAFEDERAEEEFICWLDAMETDCGGIGRKGTGFCRWVTC